MDNEILCMIIISAVFCVLFRIKIEILKKENKELKKENEELKKKTLKFC